MSLELKKIVGDEQASRLDEERKQRATKSRQHRDPDDIKVESQRRGSVAFAQSDTPRRLKRESVDIHDLEQMNMTHTGSPAKRRKSVPSAFEMPMKAEPVACDVENSGEQSADWPPSA